MKEQLTPEQSALYVKWQESLVLMERIKVERNNADAAAKVLHNQFNEAYTQEDEAQKAFINSLKEGIA